MKINLQLATMSFVIAVMIAVMMLFVPATSNAAIVTIEGAVAKVVPEKREIYVVADGKKHELYFSAKTEILKGGQVAAFELLKEGSKVKVTADKVGKRLDPLKVELVD